MKKSLKYQLLKTKLNMLLICRRMCWDKMISHIKPHSVEMGGLLIGSIFRDNHKTITTLEEVVPSRDHESSSVSLRMASSVWSDASKSCPQDCRSACTSSSNWSSPRS